MPFFGPCFGTIAKRVKKGTSAKVLFICDNIIPHERRPGDVMLTKYAFRQADYFIVQSIAVERDLLKYFPRATYRNVPHPVYENFGPALPKQEACNLLGISAKKIMLFFGYVRAYKGLNVLLDAIKEIEDALLLVVGEFYDDEGTYRKKVQQLGVESNVRFVSEYVPNEKVGIYFSAADVVVLPYLSATQSGIVQIAYNFDKPVIATDVGGLAEVVKDNVSGFIVPPHDPHELANAIRKFYDGNREREFTENVRVEKIKYSWDNLVNTMEELLRWS